MRKATLPPSHGGVINPEIREGHSCYRAPPNPPPQQISCLEDFFCSWVLQAWLGVIGICMQQLAEISTCPTIDYMTLPCPSTSNHPCIHLPTLLSRQRHQCKSLLTFRQCTVRLLELAALEFREKRLNRQVITEQLYSS